MKSEVIQRHMEGKASKLVEFPTKRSPCTQYSAPAPQHESLSRGFNETIMSALMGKMGRVIPTET